MTFLLCVVICMSVSGSLSFSYMPKRLSLRDGRLLLVTASGSFSKRKVFTLSLQ